MTRRVSHRVFRRLKDSKGTSLVEAALITPLLLLLTFGICEFASLFYVYLALENGVSQATRFGVTGNVTGTYQWDATYSGDSNNIGDTFLNDPSERTVVTAPAESPAESSSRALSIWTSD